MQTNENSLAHIVFCLSHSLTSLRSCISYFGRVLLLLLTEFDRFKPRNQTEPRKVLPILKTDEPVCPEGKLSCGNGDCVEKELFCNGKPDCKDESDENACSE